MFSRGPISANFTGDIEEAAFADEIKKMKNMILGQVREVNEFYT